jgi:hypothetical protein
VKYPDEERLAISPVSRLDRGCTKCVTNFPGSDDTGALTLRLVGVISTENSKRTAMALTLL